MIMEEHSNPAIQGQTNSEGPSPVRRRLGRGLNALLGGGGAPPPSPDAQQKQVDDHEINVALIEPNPFQPRKEFEDESLNELVASIQQHGVLQPLLVRSHGGQYQLIAGERRWLAARKAGLEHVPCRVLELEDRQVCEVAIEENLKRKDLNVLEKAQAFQDYINRFDSSIEELAKQLSMNRSTVSNYLRLLELSGFVKQSLASGKITNGHARALLSLEEADQTALCKSIQANSLSVRETEQAVRDLQPRDEQATIPFPTNEKKPAAPELTTHVQSLQDQLRDHWGVKVELRLRGKESGKIIIPFHSNDEFERLVRQLRRAA
jgi:ParB family chromosome partitioning protein